MLTTFSTQLFLQKDSVLDIWQDPKYASANILLEKIYFLSNSEDQRGIIHLVHGQNLTKTDNSYDLICIFHLSYFLASFVKMVFLIKLVFLNEKNKKQKTKKKNKTKKKQKKTTATTRQKQKINQRNLKRLSERSQGIVK